MDAQGWTIIIAAIGLAVVQVIGAVFSGLAWYKGHMASITAAEVKLDLKTATMAQVQAELESKQRDTEIANSLVVVKKEMNGKMNELLRVTGEAEHAKGVKEGEISGHQHG